MAEQFRREPDEESVCLRIHSSKDASTNPKLYFWTFTLQEVHSLKAAMRLWNQFLTLLKRNLGFGGVRVLELHEEHGCHFHVITNERFRIEEILRLGRRYGFGRTNVKRVTDAAQAVRYLCKYLSKPRARCCRHLAKLSGLALEM